MFAGDQTDCFLNVCQDFLVCSTVHKAYQLGVFTGDTYVRLSLGKAAKNTKTFANSENPFYNEYFVFELRCKLEELTRLTILYEVRKRTTCKKDVLGTLLIDLQSVWNQPHHCFFKKWGRLEGAVGDKKSATQSRGYLQIDLAIVSKASHVDVLQAEVGSPNGVRSSVGATGPSGGEESYCVDRDAMSRWQINADFDDIDKNLLQGVEASAQCNMHYSITFFKAVLVRKGDYMIQYRFHPFKGKTPVCKGTTQPTWDQEASFAWTYPSLSQTLCIQLLMHEHLTWKCVAETELYFDDIAFKDKPLLGPTFLHLYDPLHTLQYIGRLLIEIRSECPATEVHRQLTTKKVPPFDQQRWWQNENFLVEFIALQGDFLRGNLSNVKVSLNLGEKSSNHVECFLKNYTCPSKTSKGLKFFKQAPPYKAAYLRVQLPDNSLKFDSDIFMHEVVNYMKTKIEYFKMFQLKYCGELQIQAKCLHALISDALARIEEGVDAKRLEYADHTVQTPWDVNRLAYLQQFFNQLIDTLRHMRQRVKFCSAKYIGNTVEEVVQELIKCTNDLFGMLIAARVQDEWPDLLVILSTGNKNLAVCKLSAKFFLYPFRKAASEGIGGWKVRNFVFKDVQCSHTCMNCGCIVGTLQGCLGVVAEAERSDVFSRKLDDWQQPEEFYWTPSVPFTLFKCCIFIHQAKVRPGNDRAGICDPYVRVLFAGQCAETHVVRKTLSPIWNVIICFERVSLPGRAEWYTLNPPVVAVEMYESDKHTSDDYCGSGLLPMSVLSNFKTDEQTPTSGRAKRKLAVQKFQQLSNLSPPPLKWVPMATSGAVRSEVLMSAELVELVGDTERVSSTALTVTQGIPSGVRPVMRNYVVEAVFAGFRNYLKGGRHRVKIIMGDLQLSSGLSGSRIKNSVNFLVLYASGVLALPEQLEYWPAIIAKDVLVSARGAETTVGAILISNTKRFFQKEKTAKCLNPKVQPGAAFSTVSTTVQLEDDNEESPLIEKRSVRKKIWELFLYITGLFKWIVIEHKNDPPTVAEHPGKIDDGEFNWWTKFYNSLHTNSNESRHKHKLVIYQQELEKQVEFSYLQDWAEPMKLVHGLKYRKNALPKEEVYGTLKLQLKVTACQCRTGEGGDADLLRPMVLALNPKFQSRLQTLAEQCKIVARVYVVQGLQIRPKDKHSQSDSYVKVQFGPKVTTNRAQYVQNQSNPIFGKLFQLDGIMPREHVLEVSVFDRSRCCDELIGSTKIDLEDRWRSRHRATVGLALEYSKGGYNQWRDITTPHETLLDLCREHGIKNPVFVGDAIEIDGEVFLDGTEISTGEDPQERLSLTALHNLDKLHSFGYKLVPEHVETRSLYRKDYPGIEQGKIQLWVEVYGGNVTIPPAINITPQVPKAFELRAVIYDCSAVVLQEKNLFGSRMSDVYVKGWCSDESQAQYTDIHYRSLNGEANFNWRMIFPLQYSKNDDMMVVKRQSGRDAYDTKEPPVLVLQIWDEDKISSDDFLGTIEINLSNFPEPFNSVAACKLPRRTKSKLALPFGDKGLLRAPVNLFQKRNIRGWFPLVGPTHKKSDSCRVPKTTMTGKIELELELLPQAEAAANPCGLGRDPPRALSVPVRPDTSFNPFTNPWKGCTKIVLPFCRKVLLWIACILVVALVVAAFVFDVPAKIGRVFVA